jgi:hypothetical protein
MPGPARQRNCESERRTADTRAIAQGARDRQFGTPSLRLGESLAHPVSQSHTPWGVCARSLAVMR